jgi:nucleotide-binding universal stress UspA family protein
MQIPHSPNLFKNQTIVFATDFFESSRLALDYAIGFAEHYDARIVMAHAIELTQPAREAEALGHMKSVLRISAEERLDSLAAGVRRLGIDVVTHTEEGEPSAAMVRVAEAYGADMLVLGTHGVHRGLGHLLLGSNVEKLLMRSPCPTLTVGRHVMAGVDLHLRFSEVLYVSDFSPEAAAAAPYALLLARDFKAPIDVCQLMPDAAANDLQLQASMSNAYCDEMRKILPDADHYWCTPSFQLDRSLMTEQVLGRAQMNHAGVVVLGIRAESFLGRHLHTSFGYELLAKATCPILTVRHMP